MSNKYCKYVYSQSCPPLLLFHTIDSFSGRNSHHCGLFSCWRQIFCLDHPNRTTTRLLPLLVQSHDPNRTTTRLVPLLINSRNPSLTATRLLALLLYRLLQFLLILSWLVKPLPLSTWLPPSGDWTLYWTPCVRFRYLFLGDHILPY